MISKHKQFIVLPQIVPLNFGDEQIYLEESATATCGITKGDLPLVIWWTFSNHKDEQMNLTSSDGVIITRNSQKLSVLNIDTVKARHRGNYTCFAKNKGGVSQNSAYLSINGESLKIVLCFQ